MQLEGVDGAEFVASDEIVLAIECDINGAFAEFAAAIIVCHSVVWPERGSSGPIQPDDGVLLIGGRVLGAGIASCGDDRVQLWNGGHGGPHTSPNHTRNGRVVHPDDLPAPWIEREHASAHARVVILRGQANIDHAIGQQRRAPYLGAMGRVTDSRVPDFMPGLYVDCVHERVRGAIVGNSRAGVHGDGRTGHVVYIALTIEAPADDATLKVIGDKGFAVGDVDDPSTMAGVEAKGILVLSIHRCLSWEALVVFRTFSGFTPVPEMS